MQSRGVLQTDVDVFGQLSIQVVDEIVKVLQAQSTVKRSVKVQEVLHVQGCASTWWPQLLLWFLLLLLLAV